MRKPILTWSASVLVAGSFVALPAAADQEPDFYQEEQVGNEDYVPMDGGYQQDQESEKRNAQQIVAEAHTTVEKMKREDEMPELLERAKGVFIIPDFGKASIGVGAHGGQGVMLAEQQGEWSNPVFYNVGALSVGAQAGASAGEVVMVLMTDEAVDSFKQENNFSINADADLTLINWSEMGQETYGKGDVVMWSDTEGALGSLAVSVSDILADDGANEAYYDSPEATPQNILSGRVELQYDNRVANVLP